MLLQHWAVLQVALWGLWGKRGGRLWRGKQGGGGEGMNIKEKVKGVGVRCLSFFLSFFFFEDPEDKSFYLFGSSEEALLDFCLWVG